MIFKGTFSQRMDWVGTDPHKRSRIPPPNFPSSLLWNGAFLFSLAHRIKIKHGWDLVEGLCSTDSNSTSNNFSWKIWLRRITTWEKIWSPVFWGFFLPKSFTWMVVLFTKATCTCYQCSVSPTRFQRESLRCCSRRLKWKLAQLFGRHGLSHALCSRPVARELQKSVSHNRSWYSAGSDVNEWLEQLGSKAIRKVGSPNAVTLSISTLTEWLLSIQNAGVELTVV